jgi:beta-barrel assembly-enhancing protease
MTLLTGVRPGGVLASKTGAAGPISGQFPQNTHSRPSPTENSRFLDNPRLFFGVKLIRMIKESLSQRRYNSGRWGPDPGQELFMKFRLLLGTVALSALLGIPCAFSQQTDPSPADPPNASPSETKDKSSPDATTSEKEKADAKAADTKSKDESSAKGSADQDKDADKSKDKKDDASPKEVTNDKEKLPPVVQQPDDASVKHDGSKKDVNAIGNRKVGGRGLGDWYSLESEIRMGKQYAQEVEATSKLVRDPVITEYVNRIGQNLVRNSDAQVPFTIKVVDSDEVNAFALPGGFFYVNSGLILAADEESELAGVMAHEIAHVAARHATRQMTRAQWANIGTIPLIFVGGGIGYAVRSAAGLGLPLTFLSFSRGFESEADYLGLQYMYKAGYDPNAFVQFFEKLQAREKKKPGTLAKAFSTHPQTPDRISKSQEEISTILPAKAQYVVTTSEFADVKSRLAAMENRRKLVDDKPSNKPSLRRTSTTEKTGDKNGDKDDDRPTLHRRDD